ncbi:MAG: hypothetical protein IPH75_13895 [bacterium]|nr:hypothetical protein [bacterium]
MTCEQRREELDLLLGQPDLPEEMRAHLATCAECRAYAAELQSLSANLGDDSAFVTDIFESNKIGWAVEDAINRQAKPKPAWTSRIRYIAAAAVVVLAAAIGVDQYRRNISVDIPTTKDTTQLASVDTNLLPTTTLDMTDSELEQMLLDYSTLDDNAASEVLQNLTDEEMQYLEKNFDVGELL